MSPGMSQGVETLRGQDSETLGAGEEPLVADSMTRSVSFASQLSVAEPSPVAVATHRSDVLGSALEASRTVQPFSSVLGALVGDASPGPTTPGRHHHRTWSSHRSRTAPSSCPGL